MARLFVGVVLLNLGGALWLWSPLDTQRAAAEVVAPSEEVAVEMAWKTAEHELTRKCREQPHTVAGVEEVSQISNGYRARVTASGRCG